MQIKNGEKIYTVTTIAARSELYNLYVCQTGDGRSCLLQIASSTEQNGQIERAAFILRELVKRATEVEEEYKAVRGEDSGPLNYDLGFPEVVDTFVCEEQGGRRINILAFRNIERVSQMVPMSGITQKDRLRVDLKTSAWMMGKLLKLLAFAHSEGISVGRVAGDNILIEPDQHYVLIFDWSLAKVDEPPGAIPDTIQQQEIVSAAKAVIVVLGGNPESETGNFPADDDSAFEEYTQHLLKLARGCERRALRAHERFYKHIDGFWKRKFHPFTTKPL